MVRIRQRRSSALFSIIFGFCSLVFASISTWLIAQPPKNVNLTADLVFPVVCASAFGILALRANRAGVILNHDTLLIRGFLHSIHLPIDQYGESGMYWNCLHSAYLIGFKSKDGNVIKFPFWSPSWVLNDKRNLPFKEFAVQIDQTIVKCREGAPDLPPLIDTW
jgi:hypothetical protein